MCLYLALERKKNTNNKTPVISVLIEQHSVGKKCPEKAFTYFLPVAREVMGATYEAGLSSVVRAGAGKVKCDSVQLIVLFPLSWIKCCKYFQCSLITHFA